MTGLTPEQQKARAKNIVNASEAYRIMSGYDEPEPVAPPRDFEHFEAMQAYMKPAYTKGQRKFLVGEINKVMDFKVDGKLIEATLNVIKWDSSDGYPPELVTYANERVRAQIFNDPDHDCADTWAMRIGREREPDAIAELSKATGMEFLFTGDDQQSFTRNGVGATPDGMAYSSLDLPLCGGEVKSFAPLHHEACCLVASQAQLRNDEFEIFAQCQTGMYSTMLDRWAVGFYNPFSQIPELKFRYLEIVPDEKFMAVLEKRVTILRELMELRWKQIEVITKPTEEAA